MSSMTNEQAAALQRCIDAATEALQARVDELEQALREMRQGRAQAIENAWTEGFEAGREVGAGEQWAPVCGPVVEAA